MNRTPSLFALLSPVLVLCSCGGLVGGVPGDAAPTPTHGSAPVQSVDTLRPPVPAARWAAQSDTMEFPLAHLSSTLTYYRTVAGLVFDSGATGPQVRGVLAEFNAEIIAGTENGLGYIVRFPDPGPDPEALRARLAEMRRWAGVRLAYPLARRRGFVPM